MATNSQERSVNLIHCILNHESCPVIMWSATDPLVTGFYFWLRDVGSGHIVGAENGNVKLSKEADELLRDHRETVKRFTEIHRKDKKHDSKRKDRESGKHRGESSRILRASSSGATEGVY